MKKLFLLPFLLMFGATLGFTNEGAGAPEEEAVSEEVSETVAEEVSEVVTDEAAQPAEENAAATPAGDQDAD
jgi:hypothetical protein